MALPIGIRKAAVGTEPQRLPPCSVMREFPVRVLSQRREHDSKADVAAAVGGTVIVPVGRAAGFAFIEPGATAGCSE